ncbi:glycosyltransferase [Fontisphaera persica]|uniref:glycosyltransferase n=1 Tax=Fontisphaera persica TaxID=2974023 RepID=UPI0024BF143C|nr:glycosyltransferase [Fontisphaera persica]WCJ60411.1 glycosyltransferase [Fontisphaera persica]
MKVSVVIPAFNEEKLLPGTLLALKSAAETSWGQRGWPWEIIVCDNNSSDLTAQIAAEAGARVVFEPVNQIARARNTGARAARGAWLVFMDADSRPSPGLLAEVAEVMEKGAAAGGGALLQFDASAPWGHWAVKFWNLWSRALRWAPGSFLFCRAEAFHELGGFDETLFVSEEIDFSRRLKRWARQHHLQVTILSRHPLLTSGRKTHLYTLGDHLRFIGRSLYMGTRLCRTRQHCGIWYEGRR